MIGRFLTLVDVKKLLLLELFHLKLKAKKKQAKHKKLIISNQYQRVNSLKIRHLE
jgi:hypothetical protein